MIDGTEDSLRGWASDWADSYAQDWDEDRLKSYLGKMINLSRAGSEEVKFQHEVVGYDISTLCIGEEEPVHRYAFLTSQGVQIPIVAGVLIEEVV